MITLDFETHAIVGNPLINPPQAVGYSIWVPGNEPTYLRWGHPCENNISYGDARSYLKRVIDSGEELLFHNAPFDISVMEDSMSIPYQFINDGWKRIHDTMYLLFLADPYSPTLSLKPSAERYLALQPE